MREVSCRKRALIITLFSLFVTAELVLYFVIQTVPGRYFGIPTYLSIILVFLFSLVSLLVPRVKYSYLVNAALLFTLGADFCLVVLSPAEELAGVSVFIGTQTCYFLYIVLRERGALLYTHLAVRVTVTALAALLPTVLLSGDADALSTVSVIYYSTLVLNLIFSLFHKDLRLFSVGLLLFALCDLSIGLNNLSSYFSISDNPIIEAVESSELNLPWIFYLPSQVVISTSIIKIKDAQ